MRPHRVVVPALAALLAGCADPFGMRGPDVRAPDIKAMSVFFTHVYAPDQWIDTVAAGEEVMVMVQMTCDGEFPLYRVLVTANADTISDGQQGCSGGGGRGEGWSASGRSWTPPGSGVYRFTAVLDTDDQFTETDETNNTTTGTLVVLGRSISP